MSELIDFLKHHLNPHVDTEHGTPPNIDGRSPIGPIQNEPLFTGYRLAEDTIALAHKSLPFRLYGLFK
ncbi:hypothetical protein LEP1GSC060_1979 [Leptospira weilii serovar Ranarum str. ICFT]|uniref:Uncharacterized protein n=1 Tax=Leptospira weilii serovar Ranarum str. ICFT TaxID=1218598 RepID=N1WJ24_9LEPT|nr:hypothetical protein LEP1GSC060_1979 [Leptospira weilii serovar Ranarum str. ICFT]